MGKKRTGLQSEISSIFSGVPVPEKKRPPSESPAPPAKPAGPQPPAVPAKPAGVEPPRPAPPAAPRLVPVPKREVAEPSVIVQPVKPPPAPAAPKVVETKVPEPRVKQIPTRAPRRRKDKLFAPKAGVNAGRQKASIVMVAALSIALVLLLARPYYNSRSNPAVANTTGQASVGVSKAANIEIGWRDPPVYPSYLRDPMDLESKGRVVEKRDDLVVRGIVHSEDEPAALIDQKLFHVGDTVRGATIVRIERTSVTFEKDGKTWSQEVQGQEL